MIMRYTVNLIVQKSHFEIFLISKQIHKNIQKKWNHENANINPIILTDKAILDKYRNKPPQKSSQFDEQDYEDVKMQDLCFDYDEPIPHSNVAKKLYVNL